MLRKAIIGVSFCAFIGICAISVSDRAVPQLGIFRAALFKGQGLMFKTIYSGTSSLADKVTSLWWRRLPCSWNLIHGKLEFLPPATCTPPGHSLSRADSYADPEVCRDPS